MKELQRAVALLRRGNYSCVLCDRDRVLTSTKRGIAPLLERMESGESLTGVAAADRVIGKAAALLLIAGGAVAVYGQVMSEEAYRLLTETGMVVEYEKLTPVIQNREGNGPCPMERAVAGVTDPGEALPALRIALDRLKQ